MREVTYAEFSKLAAKRGHSVESLASRFRGKIENPSEFLERVMTCKYRKEDRSNVVVPYGSVIEFYSQELHHVQDLNLKHRRCACGCGQPVFDRKKWALPGCRQKIARKQSTDMQKGDRQIAELLRLDCDKISRWLPMCHPGKKVSQRVVLEVLSVDP